MYVTNQIPLPDRLLHLSVTDNSLATNIVALSMNSENITNTISSNRLLHFTVVRNNCTANEIILANNYTSIEYLNENGDTLIAVPFKNTDFEVVTLTDNNSFHITTAIHTPHLLKYFQIQIHSTFFITFGIDGLVNVWDSKTFQMITSFRPHSKLFGGVRKCVADANRRFLFIEIAWDTILYANLSTGIFVQIFSNSGQQQQLNVYGAIDQVP